MELIPRALVIFFFLLVSACGQKSGPAADKRLARVHDTYLYASELEGVVPAGTTPADSAEVVLNYIQNWIKQQLVVIHAEKNLTAAEKDFTQELDNYKKSMIAYRFESRLVKQKLDTIVAEADIEKYYHDNPGDFELKENIVRVLYVRLKLKEPNLNKVRGLLRSNKPDDRDELIKLATTIAVNSFLDENTWLFFNDLLKEIPINTYNQEEYLRNHRFVEFADDQYTYLVNFIDFRIREGQSPLSLERENIRNIIVNKRKLLLIHEMEKEVYDKALKNKDFEVF